MINEFIQIVLALDASDGEIADLDEIALGGRLIDAALQPTWKIARSQRPLAIESLSEATVVSVTAALKLSNGARRLALVNRDVIAVTSIIFADKEFRKYLRSEAGAKDQLLLASRVLKMAAALDGVYAAGGGRESEYEDHSVTPALQTSNPNQNTKQMSQLDLDNDSAEEQELPVFLERIKEEKCVYRGSGRQRSLSVSRLVSIVNSSGDASEIREAIKSLSGHSNKLIILGLRHLIRSGELNVGEINETLIEVEAARVLISLNANRSAADACERLRESPLVTRDPALLDRVNSMFARACLRSGRSFSAIRIYKERMYSNIIDVNNVFDYLVAVHQSDVPSALSMASFLHASHAPMASDQMLFLAELFSQAGRHDDALLSVYRGAAEAPTGKEHFLALANIALGAGDGDLWRKMMEQYGVRAGLQLGRHLADEPLSPFSFSASIDDVKDSIEPVVTIIMTSFNSEATIAKAIASVMCQTFFVIELVVVDDCSSDRSRELIKEIADRESRLRYVFNEQNMGTYASKNKGISLARGTYVTFHDSDDWMSPNRLQDHLNSLTDAVACTTSQWLRMRADGRVFSKRGGGYTHLNPASTFFRRAMIDSIGPFDFVRTGADAELLARIRFRFGWESVKNLDVCAALGLHHEASLTQSGDTAFDEHRYSAVRSEYTEGWVSWHLAALVNGDVATFDPFKPRSYSAPASIDVLSDKVLSEVYS